MTDPTDPVDEIDQDEEPDEDEEYDDADADADADGDGAAADGAPKAVLTYLARMIVDSPDDVEVVEEESRRGVMLRLHVAPDDMGKVIGRRGRVARALRTVVAAAGEQEGVNAQVDIVD